MNEFPLYLDGVSGKWGEDDMVAYGRVVSVCGEAGGRVNLPASVGVGEATLERLASVRVTVKALQGPCRATSALLEWGVGGAGDAWVRIPEAAGGLFLYLGASPSFFAPGRFRGGKASFGAKLYTVLLSAEVHGDLRLLPREARAVFGRDVNSADFRRFVVEPAIKELRMAGLDVSDDAVVARRDPRSKGAPVKFWHFSSLALGATVPAGGGAAALETVDYSLSPSGIYDVCRLAGVSPAEVPELWQLAITSAKEGAAEGHADAVAMLTLAAADADKAAMEFFRDL